ncbi:MULTISPECIES: hypothetical protein [Micromonospora]|uniref:Uncharacterized protein n=1 Tax=Micromonospora yangpuensis TaxID=683228 RepID=A0A1C6U571_9ACTN|nr:hypothetical protein [Micromonospora yangpuensis]GGL91968.1 hypothetical protein GCM10012279_07130 [Micromonospora yangpuensis]SCL49177.1 hypothetical protein GA0070617_1104 [Micromonospora yangpuensis]
MGDQNDPLAFVGEPGFDTKVERLALWILRQDLARGWDPEHRSETNRDLRNGMRFVDEAHRQTAPKETRKRGGLRIRGRDVLHRLRGKTFAPHEWTGIDPPPYGSQLPGSADSVQQWTHPGFANGPYAMMAMRSPLGGPEFSAHQDAAVRLAVARTLKSWIGLDQSLARLHENGRLSGVSAYYYPDPTGRVRNNAAEVRQWAGWTPEPVLDSRGRERPEIATLAVAPTDPRYDPPAQDGRRSIAPPLETYLMVSGADRWQQERVRATQQTASAAAPGQPPATNESSRHAAASYRLTSAPSAAPQVRPTRPELASNNPYRNLNPTQGPVRGR